MTPEIFSALRSLLLVLGGIVVGKGWLDTMAMDSVVGAVLALIAAWGVSSHKSKHAARTEKKKKK